jgi:DNA-binding GntR family transcriptional regulator
VVEVERLFDQYAERTQLKDAVYHHLKQAIVDLRVKPGAPLREAVVSEQLGVSKTPVREALLRLAADGLVEILPFKGAVVTGYSREDLLEIYELRELLEGACARRAATSMSPEDLASLTELVEASRDALSAGEVDRVAELFDEFDSMLFSQIRNGRIKSLLENVRYHLVRIGKLTVEIPGRVDRSNREHAEILNAIRDHDPDLAERLIREHIRGVLTEQLTQLESMERISEETADAARAVPGASSPTRNER